MVLWFAGILWIFLLVVWSKLTKTISYGFRILFGGFWDWKTSSFVGYLKDNSLGWINIANFYTGYIDFQVCSHTDILNVFRDLDDYHFCVNLLSRQEKLHKFKPKFLKNSRMRIIEFMKKYNLTANDLLKLKRDIPFNFWLDEASLYFNPRDFGTNFAGPNKWINKILFQPRKYNLLFTVVVQSLYELDVRFRRLARIFRKFSFGLGFIRWWTDYYLPNPEEPDVESGEIIGWWPIFWAYLNMYPIYPNYDYDTKEPLSVDFSIYTPGDIIRHIIYVSGVSDTTPCPNKDRSPYKKYSSTAQVFKESYWKK